MIVERSLRSANICARMAWSRSSRCRNGRASLTRSQIGCRHGLAQADSELTEQGSPAFEAAIPVPSQLLKAETAEREVRSTAYQLKTARFPAYRDLNGFDFASSKINEALVCQLHRRDSLDEALGDPPLPGATN